LKNKSINKNDYSTIILLILGFAYIFNFSRGIVRHNLIEIDQSYYIFIFDSILYIALFIEKVIIKKDIYFLPILALIMIMFSLSINNIDIKNNALDNSISRFEIISKNISKNISKSNGLSYYDKIAIEKIKKTRIIYNNDINTSYFKELCDLLLDEDDTFLDFANYSFLYSAYNREDPVYVSQSPLQLSGEFTQIQFIKQIEKNINNIPIAILPNEFEDVNSTLDGINNTYRYYLISEFIYEHYYPLIKKDKINIWVLKDKYLEYKNLLNKNDYNDLLIDELSELNDASILVNKLYYLPYIWANKDIINANTNTTIKVFLKSEKNFSVEGKTFDEVGNIGFDNVYCLNDMNFNKNSNYISFKINSNYDDNVMLLFGKVEDEIFIDKSMYYFNTVEGVNEYLIRISTDYNWYNDDINSFVVLSKYSNIAEARVLAGD
jgi:hypothetical protein